MKVCPSCGEELPADSGTRRCPSCGSDPEAERSWGIADADETETGEGSEDSTWNLASEGTPEPTDTDSIDEPRESQPQDTWNQAEEKKWNLSGSTDEESEGPPRERTWGVPDEEPSSDPASDGEDTESAEPREGDEDRAWGVASEEPPDTVGDDSVDDEREPEDAEAEQAAGESSSQESGATPEDAEDDCEETIAAPLPTESPSSLRDTNEDPSASGGHGGPRDAEDQPPVPPLLLYGVVGAIILLGGLGWTLFSGTGGGQTSGVAEPVGVSNYSAETGVEVPVATGELLVYMNSTANATKENVTALIEPFGFEIVGQVDAMSMYQIRGNHSRLDEVRRTLAENNTVRNAVPNMVLTFQGSQGSLGPRETQWKNVIRLPESSMPASCRRSTVGVIDSTVKSNHGPYVAEVVQEVAPPVRVEKHWITIPELKFGAGLKVLGADDTSSLSFASSVNARVASFLIQNNNQKATIQLSSGPLVNQNMSDSKVRAAYETFLGYLRPTIEFAELNDALVVLAAGNDNTKGTAISSPAWVEHAIFVGSVGWTGAGNASEGQSLDGNVALSRFVQGPGTNWGPNVAIYAPGEEVGIRMSDSGKVRAGFGTSLSAPQVSAAAALVRCVAPELDSTETKNLLVRTATRATAYGGGPTLPVLNVKAALEQARAIQEGRIITVERDLHHLGDDQYGGPENSQLELPSEGSELTLGFQVNGDQLKYENVTLSIRSRGTQAPNPVMVNGYDVGPNLCCSPDDGGFWVQRWSLSSSILDEGRNVVRIESTETGYSYDIDDFEFMDVTMRFES